MWVFQIYRYDFDSSGYGPGVIRFAGENRGEAEAAVKAARDACTAAGGDGRMIGEPEELANFDVHKDVEDIAANWPRLFGRA